MKTQTRTPPPAIDGFRAVEWLGGGGFADVFRYEEISLGRSVAVKVLHGGLGPVAVGAFRQEASVMAKLSNHPAIVTIYRADLAKDRRPYLVMELCPLAHLGARISRHPLSVQQALATTVQIAGAVEAAHRLGVLHRDIKPANILFGQHGKPMLTDFGISVAMDVSGGAPTALSPLWAPPEQFGRTGVPIGPASDVYSLAATLWAMLVGRSPMELLGGPNDRMSLADRVARQPSQRVNRGDVPETLERVLAAALAKRPEERYSAMLEFARDLQAVQTALHLPQTDVELLDEHLDDSIYLDTGTGTVISNFLLIQQEGPTAASGTHTHAITDVDAGATEITNIDPGRAYVLQHGSGTATPIAPLDLTTLSAPAVRPLPVPSDGPPAAIPQRSGRAVGLVVGAVALVTSIAVAIAIAVLHFAPATTAVQPTTSTAAPQDPIGVAVPRVTALKAVRHQGKVLVTWNNPDPRAGDKYVWDVVDPARPNEQTVISDTSVSVPPLPGRTCVEVQLRRANGAVSDKNGVCYPK